MQKKWSPVCVFLLVGVGKGVWPVKFAPKPLILRVWESNPGLPGKWPLKWCISACVVSQKFVDNKDFDDDDVYDELLGMKLDDDWLTQSTPVQSGILSLAYCDVSVYQWDINTVFLHVEVAVAVVAHIYLFDIADIRLLRISRASVVVTDLHPATWGHLPLVAIQACWWQEGHPAKIAVMRQ